MSRKPTRIVIDTMNMKDMALVSISKSKLHRYKIAKLMLSKILREKHVVCFCNQLWNQYVVKLQEENIPVQYFLSFIQNLLTANAQLRRMSNGLKDNVQVHVRVPKEDLFLIQTAIASNPRKKFNVYVISSEHAILKTDRRLQDRHGIRVFSPTEYVQGYC